MRLPVATTALRTWSILARRRLAVRASRAALRASLILLGVGSVLVACSPMGLDTRCRQRLSSPTDVDIGVTWEERLPGWELIVMTKPPSAECPVPPVDARARPSAGSAVGVFAQNGGLRRGLHFYVVEKEGAQSWRGFHDTGLYTCGPGASVRVKLRTPIGADGQPTLTGTYVTKGCRPELKDVTVKLRPFNWPPYVPCCGNAPRRAGEE
jgi:hypothetical protein